MGHNRLPGQQEGGWPVRHCPECMKPFEPKVVNQLFCQPAHNADWNNRATKRGRVLTPLGWSHGSRATAPEAQQRRERRAKPHRRITLRWSNATATKIAQPMTAAAEWNGPRS